MHRRNSQQADFSGGIKTQAEQQAQRIEVPGTADQPEQRAQQSGNRAAAGEYRAHFLLADPFAAAYSVKRLVHRAQDEQVDQRHQQQERGRHRGANQPTDAVKGFDFAFERRGRQGDTERGKDHHGAVPEREEQADTRGLSAFLDQLAGGVVDGGDVIGIHGMAQAEAVGQKSGAQQQRIVMEGRESPGPGQQVGSDQAGENGQDATFESHRRKSG